MVFRKGRFPEGQNVKASDLIKIRKCDVGISVPPEALVSFLLKEN